MLMSFPFSCQVPRFATAYCTQDEVTLSTSTKVAITLLESQKLSFATSARQPGMKISTKTSHQKAWGILRMYPHPFHGSKIASQSEF
jgi:hypothetical protein